MAFVAAFVAFLILNTIMGAGLAFLIAVGVGIGVHVKVGKARREAKARRDRDTREAVRNLIVTHLPALLRRKRQLDRIDDYGVGDDKKWIKEVNRFCDNIVSPALGLAPIELPRGMRSQPRLLFLDTLVLKLIDEVCNEQTTPFGRDFDPAMTPSDYEHFCAERLKTLGWNATVTQASGDQGADIVATKAGRTIVVQCKHYMSPVGNKAVQEVVAAMRHYSANAGVVVATNGFTRAAEQLASSNDIALLGHDDLANHSGL